MKSLKRIKLAGTKFYDFEKFSRTLVLIIPKINVDFLGS